MCKRKICLNENISDRYKPEWLIYISSEVFRRETQLLSREPKIEMIRKAGKSFFSLHFVTEMEEGWGGASRWGGLIYLPFNAEWALWIGEPAVVLFSRASSEWFSILHQTIDEITVKGAQVDLVTPRHNKRRFRLNGTQYLSGCPFIMWDTKPGEIATVAPPSLPHLFAPTTPPKPLSLAIHEVTFWFCSLSICVYVCLCWDERRERWAHEKLKVI